MQGASPMLDGSPQEDSPDIGLSLAAQHSSKTVGIGFLASDVEAARLASKEALERAYLAVVPRFCSSLAQDVNTVTTPTPDLPVEAHVGVDSRHESGPAQNSTELVDDSARCGSSALAQSKHFPASLPVEDAAPAQAASKSHSERGSFNAVSGRNSWRSACTDYSTPGRSHEAWAARVLDGLAPRGQAIGKHGVRRMSPASIARWAGVAMTPLQECTSLPCLPRIAAGLSAASSPQMSASKTCTTRSVRTPPSPPVPSTRRSFESELQSDWQDDPRPPMVPATGLRYSPCSSANSHCIAAAMQLRSQVPGLDMAKVRMGHDDDETEDEDETIQATRVVPQGEVAVMLPASPPKADVPQLNMARVQHGEGTPVAVAARSAEATDHVPGEIVEHPPVVRRATPPSVEPDSSSHPVDAKAEAIVQRGPMAMRTFLESEPSSSSATGPVRPPARQGSGVVLRPFEEWRGGVPRRATLGDEGPLPTLAGDWTALGNCRSTGLLPRSSSAAELRHSSSIAPVRRTRSSGGSQDVLDSSSMAPKARGSSGSLPELAAHHVDARGALPASLPEDAAVCALPPSAAPISPLSPIRATAMMADPRGAPFAGEGAGSASNRPEFEGAWVRLPPVKQESNRGGRHAGSKGGLISHVHAHHHHHYHVVLRGKKPFSTMSSTGGGVQASGSEAL